MAFLVEWIQLVALYTFAGIGFSVLFKDLYRYLSYTTMRTLVKRAPSFYFWMEKHLGYKKSDDQPTNPQEENSCAEKRYYDSMKKQVETQLEMIQDGELKTKVQEWHKSVCSIIEPDKHIDMGKFKQKSHDLVDELFELFHL